MDTVTIKVERKDQVNVLATNSSEEGKFLNLLLEGMKQKVINESQMESLLEISKNMMEK